MATKIKIILPYPDLLNYLNIRCIIMHWCMVNEMMAQWTGSGEVWHNWIPPLSNKTSMQDVTARQYLTLSLPAQNLQANATCRWWIWQWHCRRRTSGWIRSRHWRRWHGRSGRYSSRRASALCLRHFVHGYLVEQGVNQVVVLLLLLMKEVEKNYYSTLCHPCHLCCCKNITVTPMVRRCGSPSIAAVAVSSRDGCTIIICFWCFGLWWADKLILARI